MSKLLLAIAMLATGSLAFAEGPEAGEEAPPPVTTAAEDAAAPADSAAPGDEGETMDLTGDEDTFAPYNNERHPAWALLPTLAIGIVLLHLRKSKPQPKLVKGQQT